MHKCEKCGEKFETARKLQGHKLGAHKSKETAKEKNINQSKPNLTADQQAIAERVSKQDTDWFTLREDELEDFSLMNNPFDLPPEAAKLQNEKVYAFRYCERTPERIDELTRSVSPPLRWAICNRQNASFIGHLVDDMIGCVVKLDQVLLFKPWSHHQLVKNAKQEMADAQAQSGDLKGKKEQLQQDGVEAFEGDKYKITSGDDIQLPEAPTSLVDADDGTELGDLLVAE